MNIEQFNAFRERVHESGVIFYFNGYLSQTIIAAIGDALRSKLESDDGRGPTTRKVFSVFVEMMQNIVHYSDEAMRQPSAGGLSFGTVAVGRKGEKYFIACGNPVRNEHVDRIRAKLDAISAMSRDEIKTLYKRKLREENEATSKGAGLGFLTVARDASEPIDYFFATHPDDAERLSFFYLKASI